MEKYAEMLTLVEGLSVDDYVLFTYQLPENLEGKGLLCREDAKGFLRIMIEKPLDLYNLKMEILSPEKAQECLERLLREFNLGQEIEAEQREIERQRQKNRGDWEPFLAAISEYENDCRDLEDDMGLV